MFGKEAEKVGNQRKIRDLLDYSFVENDENSEKSPGDQKILAVTQTPAKDHQPTLLWKTHRE